MDDYDLFTALPIGKQLLDNHGITRENMQNIKKIFVNQKDADIIAPYRKEWCRNVKQYVLRAGYFFKYCKEEKARKRFTDAVNAPYQMCEVPFNITPGVKFEDVFVRLILDEKTYLRSQQVIEDEIRIYLGDEVTNKTASILTYKSDLDNLLARLGRPKKLWFMIVAIVVLIVILFITIVMLTNKFTLPNIRNVRRPISFTQ